MNHFVLRLNWFQLVNINLVFIAFSIRNNAVQGIFLPYMVETLADPASRNTTFGIIRAAGLVVAMLAQPVFGILSDRSTSRYGRRRPYIFFGTLIDIFFLAIIAMSGNLGIFVVGVLLLQFSANISHGSAQGLIPDLVPEDQRGVASGIKSIFELLPVAFLGVTIASVVGAGQYQHAVLVTSAAFLAIVLVSLPFIKEKPLQEKPDVPLAPALFRVLGILLGIGAGALAGVLAGLLVGGILAAICWLFWGSATAWLVWIAVGGVTAMLVATLVGVLVGTRASLGNQLAGKPAFTWWVGNRLYFLAAITSIQSFAPFFMMATFSIDMQAAITVYGRLISVVGICTLLSAIPSGWLSDRIGQVRLVGISGILAILAVILLILTVWFPLLWIIYLVGVILGITAGLFVTTNWALGTRLAPQDQAGRFLGVANIAGAGAGIVGAGIGGWIADQLNLANPGLGYLVIFGGYGLMFALSILTLRGVSLPDKNAIIHA